MDVEGKEEASLEYPVVKSLCLPQDRHCSRRGGIL